MKRTFWGTTHVRRWWARGFWFTAILRYTLHGRERRKERRFHWWRR
jgi:hypothetical protein